MAPDTRKQSMRRSICSLAIACWVCSQERVFVNSLCGCWLSGTFWTSCGWWWVLQVWKTFERIPKQLIDLIGEVFPQKKWLDVLIQEVFPWKKQLDHCRKCLLEFNGLHLVWLWNFLRVLAKRSPVGEVYPLIWPRPMENVGPWGHQNRQPSPPGIFSISTTCPWPSSPFFAQLLSQGPQWQTDKTDPSTKSRETKRTGRLKYHGMGGCCFTVPKKNTHLPQVSMFLKMRLLCRRVEPRKLCVNPLLVTPAKLLLVGCKVIVWCYSFYMEKYHVRTIVLDTKCQKDQPIVALY